MSNIHLHNLQKKLHEANQLMENVVFVYYRTTYPVNRFDLERAIDALGEFLKIKQPFKPGERIEYCGGECIVVSNDGDSGLVDVGRGQHVKFYWVFDGTEYFVMDLCIDYDCIKFF